MMEESKGNTNHETYCERCGHPDWMHIRPLFPDDQTGKMKPYHCLECNCTLEKPIFKARKK